MKGEIKTSAEIANEVNKAVKYLVQSLESGRLPDNEKQHDALMAKRWLPVDAIESAIKQCEKKYGGRYERLKQHLGLAKPAKAGTRRWGETKAESRDH